MNDSKDREILIGLIVGGIANEFSKSVIKGIVNAIPKNKNIRLAVLPGELMLENFQSKQISQYNYMCNSVYNLGNVCRMDGIIIAMGSIGWALNEDKTRHFLGLYSDIPTVLIASDYEDYTTVNYDNRMGISEAVEVLIGVYGITDIGMIGGYTENIDSARRKSIFIECLEENGIDFRDSLYEASDMSENSEEAAERLLDNNPQMKAIFCVNDATAVGLYRVLKKRNLVPGKDIMVFGFDNTRMAAEMSPPLSSIGASSITLGQKAFEMLLDKIEGEKVTSQFIPTSLYGRESLRYDKYEYSLNDLSLINETIINRMFDDCFYRYNTEHISSENINLKRLFYEILNRMFKGIKRRYIGIDEFNEIGNLIDIFFRNGAMDYTDVWKFLKSVTLLQTGINKQLRGRENTFVNRLFLRMTDDALVAVSESRARENNENNNSRVRLRRFLIKGMNYANDKKKTYNEFINSLDIIGLDNAALYLFEKPVTKEELERLEYPDTIKLIAVVKSGNVYVIPESKQKRLMADIFIQREIKIYNKKFVTFPLFYENTFYGLFLCELNNEIYNKGALIANELGMIIHIINIS
ncbi:DNA-binding transcriptional regulator, LacI/PurR family [Lachnospiraceae bacterium]|nr:DNA-binding transcriptional regulator, LacI/PurR family [Lachnospiraceae bacterium]